MKLSGQAIGALMMALQKCILEQSDIVPMLKEFEFGIQLSSDVEWSGKGGNKKEEELVVLNPPKVKIDHPAVNVEGNNA